MTSSEVRGQLCVWAHTAPCSSWTAASLLFLRASCRGELPHLVHRQNYITHRPTGSSHTGTHTQVHTPETPHWTVEAVEDSHLRRPESSTAPTAGQQLTCGRYFTVMLKVQFTCYICDNKSDDSSLELHLSRVSSSHLTLIYFHMQSWRAFNVLLVVCLFFKLHFYFIF